MPRFAVYLIVIALVGSAVFLWVTRKPTLGVPETVRAFLEAARSQDFVAARAYCTPDLAPHAIRGWMVGGFTYEVLGVSEETQSTAELEAVITKESKKLYFAFRIVQWRQPVAHQHDDAETLSNRW